MRHHPRVVGLSETGLRPDIAPKCTIASQLGFVEPSEGIAPCLLSSIAGVVFAVVSEERPENTARRCRRGVQPYRVATHGHVATPSAPESLPPLGNA